MGIDVAGYYLRCFLRRGKPPGRAVTQHCDALPEAEHQRFFAPPNLPRTVILPHKGGARLAEGVEDVVGDDLDVVYRTGDRHEHGAQAVDTVALISNEALRNTISGIVAAVVTGGVAMVIILAVDNRIFAPWILEKGGNNGMKLEKKAVIFDLDRVICFTDRFHYQAWKALADQLHDYVRMLL